MIESDNSYHYQKFLAFFDQWEKDIREINACAKKFKYRLASELILHSIRYYPELETHIDKFSKSLKECLLKCGHEIAETLDMMFHSSEEQQWPESTIPERFPQNNQRPFSDETGKKLSPEKRKYFEQDWEMLIKREAFENEFLFQCHDKIKEIIYIHYPEIINLSPNNFRWLDFSTYVSAIRYKDEFYYYTGAFIIDRFPEPEYSEPVSISKKT